MYPVVRPTTSSPPLCYAGEGTWPSSKRDTSTARPGQVGPQNPSNLPDVCSDAIAGVGPQLMPSLTRVAGKLSPSIQQTGFLSEPKFWPYSTRFPERSWLALFILGLNNRCAFMCEVTCARPRSCPMLRPTLTSSLPAITEPPASRPWQGHSTTNCEADKELETANPSNAVPSGRSHATTI